MGCIALGTAVWLDTFDVRNRVGRPIPDQVALAVLGFLAVAAGLGGWVRIRVGDRPAVTASADGFTVHSPGFLSGQRERFYEWQAVRGLHWQAGRGDLIGTVSLWQSDGARLLKGVTSQTAPGSSVRLLGPLKEGTDTLSAEFERRAKLREVRPEGRGIAASWADG